MGLYLYGISQGHAAGRRGALGTGIAGAPVVFRTHRGLAAAVSKVADDALLNPSARQLRHDLAAHADVLNRLASWTAVLPARFGIIFPNDKALARELLDPQYEALSADLQRVDGAVEVGLQAKYIEDAVLTQVLHEELELGQPSEALDSRLALGEYVAQAVRSRKEQEAQELLDQLAPLAREAAIQDTRTDLCVLRASFLVDRDRLDEFDRVVNRLAAEAGHLRMVCVGPLAPYSFVHLRLAAEELKEA